MTLPYEWEMIRAAYQCSRPIQINGPWEELPDSCEACACCGDECATISQATSIPIYHGFPLEGQRLLVEGGGEGGIGKFVVHGKDRAGSELHEILRSGEPSSQVFSSIVAVLKQATKAPVRLWALHPHTGVRTILSIYAAAQTNPQFSRYILNNAGDRVIVRVKKRLPVMATMDDLSPICNHAILALLFQAANHVGRDNDAYVKNMTLAEESLNENIESSASDSGRRVTVVMDRAQNLTPSRTWRR